MIRSPSCKLVSFSTTKWKMIMNLYLNWNKGHHHHVIRQGMPCLTFHLYNSVKFLFELGNRVETCRMLPLMRKNSERIVVLKLYLLLKRSLGGLIAKRGALCANLAPGDR